MRLAKFGVFGLGAAVLVVISLTPIPYLASPDWQVWVVDESGSPVPDALVRLEYQNYSVEMSEHEEDRVADSQGYAHFPEHRRSASIIQRCWYSGLSARALAHASFGLHDWVLAFGNGTEGEAISSGIVVDWPGNPERMESRIVLKPTLQ